MQENIIKFFEIFDGKLINLDPKSQKFYRMCIE